MNKDRHRNLVAEFRGHAEEFFALNPSVDHRWQEQPAGRALTLWISGTAGAGFDVGIDAQEYGLYPMAGECWRGAPWDVATPRLSIPQMCKQALAWVRVLLCSDGRLRIQLLAGTAYRWTVEFASPQGWLDPESCGAGTIRSWWLARRLAQSEQVRQNAILPPIGLATGLETTSSFIFSRHGG